MTRGTSLLDAPPSQASSDSSADVPLLEAELRRAIEEEEFRVLYQPIVSLSTHRVAGFEALVRWESPHRGLVRPQVFLPLAEETGLIVPLGRWVLRSACARTRAWQLQYPQSPPLFVSVNLSARQFEQPDLVEQVSLILDETGLPSNSLQLEITETLVMQNPEAARAMLLQLRACDVRLSIDDFGTGFSSLSYVGRFPVHTLKIDRAFIAGLEYQKENLEIVRAIVTMARNLGLDVTAEGVETRSQIGLLKLLGCDRIQGYLVSKPVDESRAEQLIAAPPVAEVAQPVPGPADRNRAAPFDG